MATPPPSTASRTAAFTLVEIMVVVVVIGLLAAMAIPAFQRVRERSLASRYVNDFRQFDSAFQRYILENGVSPPAGAPGGVPAGMAGYLPAGFTAPSPMGGSYQWSGPSSTVVIRNSQATDAIMQQVDVSLDDGNLATGEFVKIAGVGYGYHVR
ncbi:MAG TPA: prepilin-type N-terminal cleavage/methylation domain-containing protein [Opitutaceae bacterium]|nr:prepilin-type N-terminal cleavage/methylation domain-containing protein [Opitutaceae bacterium]